MVITIPMGTMPPTRRNSTQLGRGDGGDAEARLPRQTWDASLWRAASKDRGLPRLCGAAAKSETLDDAVQRRGLQWSTIFSWG